MNQSQNESKPLTAEQVYNEYQREASPHVKRELRLSKRGVIEVMERYAAQQAKDAEENATWAHDQLQSVQEELLFYKDKYSKLKQVTEERDKAVELLAEILQEDGNRRFLYSAERSIITNFLNSLNAAGSDTGKK